MAWKWLRRYRAPEKRQASVRPRLEELEDRSLPSATLVAGLGTHTGDAFPPDPGATPPAQAGGKLFFTANGGTAQGDGVWASDGTASGTTLLAKARAYSLTPLGNKMFFTTQGPGWELWVSDGSAAGTHFVKDVNPAPRPRR